MRGIPVVDAFLRVVVGLCVVAVVLLVLSLTGCASQPKIEVPKVVHVPVDKFVPLDPALTAKCQQEAARDQTIGEAIRLAEKRRIWLEDCAKRMERIRALQP